MNLSEHKPELALYETYTLLQSSYRELYRDLEEQYRNCRCLNCKLNLVTLGFELLSLNTFVSQLESQIIPPIADVLQALDVDYEIKDQQTRLLN